LTKGEMTDFTKDCTLPLGIEERLVWAFDWACERGVRSEIVVAGGGGGAGDDGGTGGNAAVLLDDRRSVGDDLTTVTRTGRTRSISQVFSATLTR
jgi:hypothetical protein